MSREKPKEKAAAGGRRPGRKVAQGGRPYLTVAIPCYNEEAILEANYRRLQAACEAQETQGFRIDGEITHRRPVFRSHVANGGTIRQ